MYRLLHPIHTGLGVLIQEVEDHIKQMSLDIVKSLDGDNVRNDVFAFFYLFNSFYWDLQPKAISLQLVHSPSTINLYWLL